MGLMTDATDGFTLLTALKALAGRLAEDIDACRVGNQDDMKLVPGLARQYRETMCKIDALEGGDDGDDEIAAIIVRNRQPGSD